MDADTLCNKFLGSVLGTAVGDSVGAGFEGLHGFTEDQVHAVAERRKVLRYTDDTHMMIGVAESLIIQRGFDGQHMADRFIYNYNWEPFRGYGLGPPRIFAAIQEGEPWDKASEKLYLGGSYGNGAAMRIAPVGFFYYDDPQKLRDIAYESSHITHAHVLGKEGAALQAYAVALATSLDPASSFDRKAFLRKLRDFVENDTYKEKLQTMEDLWDETDKVRVAADLGNGIEAFNSVPAAIFSFLTHPSSFDEAVVYAICLGGDTDTIGAMAGAISGAYLGMDAIPAEWLAKLENRLYIEPLATELWQIKTE
ncbi:ADP-ribosylglycohydrolase family protein [Chloroflexota bacterium]